jgi:uncharacterized protein (DUF885 family)
MNELFVQEVQSDTLSLNYALAYPEKYGITDPQITLGDYSINNMKVDLIDTENHLKTLQLFNYKQLNSKEKLTYDIVKNYLEQNLQFGNYLYYSECLGPTTGIQAQLPILLAEYSFHDKQDIEQYLKLLPCVKDYFHGIIQYENEKSQRGLFMSDKVADRIIDQCEAFITDPENNFLISYFNQKIADYKGLTKQEISYYKAMNKEAVICYVVPAYQDLIAALKELKGTGTNNAGLYYYPQGQAYYECLAKYKTGSNKSMEEMNQMLESAMEKGIAHISELSQQDPNLVDKYLSFSSFPITNPKDILKDLKKDITADFPAAVPVSCQIKYVPASLADYLSPAMYLVPPIDSYNDNNIYINGNSKKTLSMIYTTVAHEGYPGHLYQCVYFRSKHPAPIRNILNFTGYDEGWATYVEYYSYHFAGIDENLADFLETNNRIVLCMYARADIGIHYQSWTKEKTVDFIRQYISDDAIAGEIYDTLLEEPAIYLPYAIGYLEIIELKEKAENVLGDKFSSKDFHKFLLDIGPAQFDIIDKKLDEWLKNY